MNEEEIVKSGQEEMVRLAEEIQQQSEIKMRQKEEELEQERVTMLMKWSSKELAEKEKIRDAQEKDIERMVKRVSKDVDKKLEVIRKKHRQLERIEKSALARDGKAQIRQKQLEIARKIRQHKQKDVLMAVERALKSNNSQEPNDEDYVTPATRALLIPKIEMNADDSDEEPSGSSPRDH